MIESIISLSLQLFLPFVSLFVKDADKRRQLREKMLKAIQNHGQSIARNAQMHIEYQAMEEKAKQEQEKKEV